MKFGDLELEIISEGTISLDGGAMFGVVPRVIWEKRLQPDEFNRVRLGVNCLLIRGPMGNILVDTGCGTKYSSKELEIYQMRREHTLSDQLRRSSLSPEDIDIVINTHLHFDHAGGNTVRENGKAIPMFPRARYMVQDRELKDAREVNERTRASYFPENWEPLVQTGQLETVRGEHEVVPGVYLEPTPGHTLGHQSVRVERSDQSVYFIGDLCPTSAHVPLPWIMGYDLFPLMTLETRRKVYRRAVDEDWLVVFEHDAEHPLGRLSRNAEKYECTTQDPAGWVL